MFAISTLLVLAVITLYVLSRFVPAGTRRWREPGPWFSLAGSLLPPIVWAALSVGPSENTAVMGIIVALVTLALAWTSLAVGLFCPPSWPNWRLALASCAVSGMVVMTVIWMFAPW